MYQPEGTPAAAQRMEPFAALLIADAAMAGAATEAIAFAGGRLLARVDWAAVPQELGRHAARPVIVVEVTGVADATLVDMLPRIDAIATALDLAVIVALDEAQIDIVARALLGSGIQLLCHPSMAERVGAIALAAETNDATLLADSWREGESARLRRLNQEVARIAEVLARLTRNDHAADAAAEAAERRERFEAEPAPAGEPIDPAELRRVIRARRMRDQFFGAGLFEDPAWDMLLDLFAAELEGVQVSVSSLCIAASVAPTTALRWIAKMSDAGLFIREPDPFDRRRAFMALAPRASQGMRGYVAAVKRVGLTVA